MREGDTHLRELGDTHLRELLGFDVAPRPRGKRFQSLGIVSKFWKPDAVHAIAYGLAVAKLLRVAGHFVS